MRVEHEGGTAAWLAGTLAAPSVQGHRLPPLQELWPYQSLFSKPLVAGDKKASLASLPLQPRLFRHLRTPLPGVLLCCSARQAHRGPPLTGVLLCRSVHQALKGAPWVGVLLCRSVHQAFDGTASLLFSCRCWRVGEERLW